MKCLFLPGGTGEFCFPLLPHQKQVIGGDGYMFRPRSERTPQACDGRKLAKPSIGMAYAIAGSCACAILGFTGKPFEIDIRSVTIFWWLVSFSHMQKPHHFTLQASFSLSVALIQRHAIRVDMTALKGILATGKSPTKAWSQRRIHSTLVTVMDFKPKEGVTILLFELSVQAD